MDGLFQLFDRIEPLSAENRQYILGILKRRLIKKKEIFLKPGQISRHIYFIETGLVQCYRTVRGKDETMWFMKENDIIVSVGSFFKQIPGFDYLVALEDTVAWSASYTDLEHAYNRFQAFNRHRGVILEQYYALSEIRHHYRQQPPDLAFASMMEHEPWILNRVTRKLLGSYLGIDPVTLRKTITQYFRGRRM